MAALLGSQGIWHVSNRTIAKRDNYAAAKSRWGRGERFIAAGDAVTDPSRVGAPKVRSRAALAGELA